MQKGPSYSSSAATYPEKSANAQSRKSRSMRACAFFPPSLDPVLDGGKREKAAVVAPEGPTRGPVGQAVFDHQPYRQIHHAVGVLSAGWRQIREVGVKVLATLRTVMLRIGDDEIAWTPEVEIAQVVQRPLKLLVPIGGVPAAWTGLPRVSATIGDDLWRWQVCNRGNPFGGIGSIRTRTEHGCVLRDHMLGPELYDKCPSGAIPKPGKDAIVSKCGALFLESRHVYRHDSESLLTPCN